LPRILIVDDEVAVRSMLAHYFARAGFEVNVAASALEAMEICDAKQFDAVLSDVDMPRMNGHELARWMAVKHPRTVSVLMSGFGIDCEECPLAGGCVLLRKPFRPQEAVAQVTRILNEPKD